MPNVGSKRDLCSGRTRTTLLRRGKWGLFPRHPCSRSRQSRPCRISICSNVGAPSEPVEQRATTRTQVLQEIRSDRSILPGQRNSVNGYGDSFAGRIDYEYARSPASTRLSGGIDTGSAVVDEDRSITGDHIVRVALLRRLRRCHGVDLGRELGFRSTTRRQLSIVGDFDSSRDSNVGARRAERGVCWPPTRSVVWCCWRISSVRGGR